MEITFLGVGEACDCRYPNTSILLKTDIGRSFLLDCGFTVPHEYFRFCADPDELDALWISHFHGDHFFGVPLLLLRFWEMGRMKPLQIIGQFSVERKIQAAMDLAYPNFGKKLQYDLEFVSMNSGESLVVSDLGLRTAETLHSQPCLALRLDEGEKSLFYSGDGRSTAATLELAHGCNLVIHEAFKLSEEVPGHGSVCGCLDFCRRAHVRRLALVHLNCQVRREKRDQIRAMINTVSGLGAFLPEPGDVVKL